MSGILLSYPTLTDLIRDIFGVNIPLPIQTYGFFVATAFLVGAYVLTIEFKRKEKEGHLVPIPKTIIVGEPASLTSIISSGVISFIIGYKLVDAIFNYSLFVDNPQGFLLSARGNFAGGLIIGLASAFFTWWDKNRKKLDKPVKKTIYVYPHELSGNILVIAGVFGLLGAKIFHNLSNFDDFMADPWHELISFSGLAFYGGFIVGFIALYIYFKRNNVPILHAMDVAGLVIPLSYAVGRIGCQTSGDGCWGIPNPNPKPDWLSWLPDWAWAYDFPHNVINEGILIDGCVGKHCHVLATPVYPTSLYELSIMFVVFLILWSIRKKIKVPGTIFALYLIFGGIERYFVEKIRVNHRYQFWNLNMTQAEIISLFMIITGAVGIFILYKYKDKVLEMAKPRPVEKIQNNDDHKKNITKNKKKKK